MRGVQHQIRQFPQKVVEAADDVVAVQQPAVHVAEQHRRHLAVQRLVVDGLADQVLHQLGFLSTKVQILQRTL